MNKKNLLTMKEQCKLFKCCFRTIKHLLIEEGLPAILSPGNKGQFDPIEISNWLKSCYCGINIYLLILKILFCPIHLVSFDIRYNI